MIGAWLATFVVVGALVVVGAFFAFAAKRKFARLAAVYAETRE
mgnify:FL=1